MTFMLPFLVGVGSCGLLCALAFLWLFTRQRKERSWNDLVARLYKIEPVGLSAVALDYMTPRHNQIDLEMDEIWDFLGGYQGLRKMRENAEIMLEMAAFAQRWNFQEAAVVTVRMRMDAVTLRRALLRVELGLVPFKLLRRFQLALPLNAQEASSAYYLMRQRLLFLYETSHEGLYPTLAASL